MMKLYCWHSTSYGEEAFVAAESEEDARLALSALRRPYPDEPKPTREEWAAKYELWNRWHRAEYYNRLIDAILDRGNADYKLVVLEPGQVAWAARS